MDTLLRYRGYILLSLAFVVFLGLYVTVDRWPRPEAIEIVDTAALAEPASAGTRAGAAAADANLPAATATTPVLLRVHVAGAVRVPGVYDLSADSRVIDAVEAAGGLDSEADADLVNLADRVNDGQQVYIPFVATPAPPSPTPLAVDQPTVAGGQASSGLVNINTASAGELETLPGIGPVLAERIIAYRTESGPFADIGDIESVRGIGPACFGQIEKLICVQ